MPTDRLLAIAILACFATLAQPAVAGSESHRMDHDRRPEQQRGHSSPPYPHGFDPRRDVDVGVVLPADQLEHWPSNYVPDGYRLNGYDGQPNGQTVCRHADGGMTISTSGVDCPEGNSKGMKSWSTQ